jgi:hypothetical protein
MPRPTRYAILTFNGSVREVYDAGTDPVEATRAAELFVAHGVEEGISVGAQIVELHPLIELPGTRRPLDANPVKDPA